MSEFTVTYEVTLESDSHDDAARTVGHWLRDGTLEAPVLIVTDGTETKIIDTENLSP